jgi:hypothetical protein
LHGGLGAQGIGGCLGQGNAAELEEVAAMHGVWTWFVWCWTLASLRRNRLMGRPDWQGWMVSEESLEVGCPILEGHYFERDGSIRWVAATSGVWGASIVLFKDRRGGTQCRFQAD